MKLNENLLFEIDNLFLNCSKNNLAYTYGIIGESKEIINMIVDYIIKQVKKNKVGYNSVFKLAKSLNDSYVEFKKGGLIKIFMLTENARGNRYCSVILDKNIKQEYKELLVYPKVILLNGSNGSNENNCIIELPFSLD